MAAYNPAFRRYIRRFVPLTIAYGASVSLATAVIPDHAPASLGIIAIAVLPGLAVVGWLWAMARLLVELDDEYLRMLEVRKFLIATGTTLALTSIWGILELYTPAVPKLPVFFVFPLWCLGLAVGAVFNRLRFGSARWA